MNFKQRRRDLSIMLDACGWYLHMYEVLPVHWQYLERIRVRFPCHPPLDASFWIEEDVTVLDVVNEIAKAHKRRRV